MVKCSRERLRHGEVTVISKVANTGGLEIPIVTETAWHGRVVGRRLQIRRSRAQVLLGAGAVCSAFRDTAHALTDR